MELYKGSWPAQTSWAQFGNMQWILLLKLNDTPVQIMLLNDTTVIDTLILSIFETNTSSCIGLIVTTQQIYNQDKHTRRGSTVVQ